MSDYINIRENYIHPTAQIGPNVKIGTGNYIGPFCIIGYPAEHKGFWGKPDGGVEIGDDCVITGHVTIDSGTEHPTCLGSGIWMLKHSHVGHDAVIGDKATISCGAKVGGHAIVGPGTNIGLNACIHQWVEVPEGCMIGMNAAVTKKLQLEPNRKYAGVPAKDIGSNLKQDQITKAILPDQSLWDKIKANQIYKVLGESKGKYIFVLDGVKDGPVMILVPAEGKVYTSGLGLLCKDEHDLKCIFKHLGYNV